MLAFFKSPGFILTIVAVISITGLLSLVFFMQKDAYKKGYNAAMGEVDSRQLREYEEQRKRDAFLAKKFKPYTMREWMDGI